MVNEAMCERVKEVGKERRERASCMMSWHTGG